MIWRLALIGCLCLRKRVQVMRIIEADQDSTLLVDTQLRQRRWGHGELPVSLWRQTQGQAEEYLQGPAMRHEPHSVALTGGDNARVDCPDALGQLRQRFPFWGSAVQLITLPGSQ